MKDNKNPFDSGDLEKLPTVQWTVPKTTEREREKKEKIIFLVIFKSRIQWEIKGKAKIKAKKLQVWKKKNEKRAGEAWNNNRKKKNEISEVF